MRPIANERGEQAAAKWLFIRDWSHHPHHHHHHHHYHHHLIHTATTATSICIFILIASLKTGCCTIDCLVRTLVNTVNPVLLLLLLLYSVYLLFIYFSFIINYLSISLSYYVLFTCYYVIAIVIFLHLFLCKLKRYKLQASPSFGPSALSGVVDTALYFAGMPIDGVPLIGF